MQARIEELEQKLGVFKSKKKKNKLAGNSAKQMCLSLPMNIEREEMVVLSK